MKEANSTRGGRMTGLLVAAFIGAILALLFWRSFLPGVVHFSNDGPLGVQANHCMEFPGAFTAIWFDTNVLGGSGGAWAPSIINLFRAIAGPVGYSKFLVPFAMWLGALCAWYFFRRRGLCTMAGILGTLAFALNPDFFSTACWGVASQVAAFGMSFLALGLVAANSPSTRLPRRLARLALAGLAVGMGVMEAADVGALFSILVAATVLYQSLVEDGPALRRVGRGILRVAVVAGFAGILAAHTVNALIQTQIHGIVGTGQDAQSRAQHWNWATQLSMPKREALAVVIPGLFGYRLDTPDGANYWGLVGSDPAWDTWYAGGGKGPQPPGFNRFFGNSVYAGASVVLVAFWAAFQALRRKDSVFSPQQRRYIWYWMAVAVVTLLLGFGRFAPFYKIIYALPYFSTVRNPIKFLHILHFAILILFAYGVDGLFRRYLSAPATGAMGSLQRLKAWWPKAGAFERRWIQGCGLLLALSLLGWFLYAASRPDLEKYIQLVQFDASLAHVIAGFSIRQVGWFVLFFVLTGGVLALAMAGAPAGPRAKWAGLLLGVIVAVDLARADLPWMIFWDYTEKYATNPIIDILRDKPYEHRVAYLPFKTPPEFEIFNQLYTIEWAQHHFLYYNIQSLALIQMPRMPEDLAAFEGGVGYDGAPNHIHRICRRWELTNTRYLLGPAPLLDILNQQFDPGRRRFRFVQRFDLVGRDGVAQPTKEQITAALKPDGAYGLIEFTGALPRARLYGNWQLNTNLQQTLETLANPDFDPQQTVLVASPDPLPSAPATNPVSATVSHVSYTSRRILFNAKADAPTVLLLNDRYDPNWSVTVDGKPAQLLRCNYIMRGAYLPAGTHTVEFRFQLPHRLLYLTVAAIALGVLLAAFLTFTKDSEHAPAA